jgi:hypothetical protein
MNRTATRPKNKPLAPARWWAAFISLALIEAVLLFKLLTSETSGELLISISVIALLLVLSPRISDLISITLNKEGLEAKLADIEEDLNEAKSEIEKANKKIDELFLLSMSIEMYENLKKLVSGHFGQYEKKKGSGFERELYHLRSLGYIRIPSIQKIPEKGENLSVFVEVTDAGRDFVKLRESLINSQ